MAGFLNRLVSVSVGNVPHLTPRKSSKFESVYSNSGIQMTEARPEVISFENNENSAHLERKPIGQPENSVLNIQAENTVTKSMEMTEREIGNMEIGKWSPVTQAPAENSIPRQQEVHGRAQVPGVHSDVESPPQKIPTTKFKHKVHARKPANVETAENEITPVNNPHLPISETPLVMSEVNPQIGVPPFITPVNNKSLSNDSLFDMPDMHQRRETLTDLSSGIVHEGKKIGAGSAKSASGSSDPVIEIRIGRVELTATVATENHVKEPRTNKHVPSLADYLGQQDS